MDDKVILTGTRSEDYKSLIVLRIWLGILGLLLPTALIIHDKFGNVRESISHYYYDSFGYIFFIGILSSIALLLISYRRNQEHDGKKKTFLSDGLVSNIAGIGLLIMLIVPTEKSTKSQCCDINQCIILKDCVEINGFLGHDICFWGWVHLGGATLFLIFCAIMSYSNFSIRAKKGEPTWLYKLCAVIMFVCLLAMGIVFLTPIKGFANYIFWGEALSVYAFGIAWLTKSKFYNVNTLRSLISMR